MKRFLCAVLAVFILAVPLTTSADSITGYLPNYTGDAATDYMAQTILDGIITADMSPYDQIKAIYDWEVLNFERSGAADTEYFDIDALSSQIEAYGSYTDGLLSSGLITYDSRSDLEARSAKNMMIEHVGSCLEFSAVFQVLTEHLGYDCRTVRGYFHNSDGSTPYHVWNYICFQGQWYWVDVRIDHASYIRSGREDLYYDYFMITDEEEWEERHSWDSNANPYPFAGTGTAVEPEQTAGDAGQTDDQTFGWTDPAGDQTADETTDSGIIYTGQNEVLPDIFEENEDAQNSFTSEAKTAVAANAAVLINGVSDNFDAYNIDGYNYFKLRDIAYALSGSAARFEIGWSGEYNLITLTSGLDYSPVGGEMTCSAADSTAAVPATAAVALDGMPLALTAYNINGNNYFKLRDLAAALNFGVYWDGSNNTIAIVPAEEYNG